MAKCRVPGVPWPAEIGAWRGLLLVRQWFSTKLRRPTREEWLLPLPRAGGRTEIRRLTSAEALTRHVKTWVLRDPVRDRGTEAWLAGNKRRDQSLPFCGAGPVSAPITGSPGPRPGAFVFIPHIHRGPAVTRGPSSFAARSAPSVLGGGVARGRPRRVPRARRGNDDVVRPGLAARRTPVRHLVAHRRQALEIGGDRVRVVVGEVRVHLPRHGWQEHGPVGAHPGTERLHDVVGAPFAEAGFHVGREVARVARAPRPDPAQLGARELAREIRIAIEGARRVAVVAPHDRGEIETALHLLRIG